MTAGELTHRITIQQNTPTVSATGAQVPSWSTFAQRWASIVPETAREFFAARQTNAEVSLVLKCPGFMAVTPSMRVLHSDGRVFDIVGIRPTDGKAPANSAALLIDLIEGKRKES